MLPLLFVGTDPKNPDMPIEATDDQGKRLTLTIAGSEQSVSGQPRFRKWDNYDHQDLGVHRPITKTGRKRGPRVYDNHAT